MSENNFQEKNTYLFSYFVIIFLGKLVNWKMKKLNVNLDMFGIICFTQEFHGTDLSLLTTPEYVGFGG